jgi:hypothetical protein
MEWKKEKEEKLGEKNSRNGERVNAAMSLCSVNQICAFGLLKKKKKSLLGSTG